MEFTNSSSAPWASRGKGGRELRPNPRRSKAWRGRRWLSESRLRIQSPMPPPKPCTITRGVRPLPRSGDSDTVQILAWFGREMYRATNRFWRPEDGREKGEGVHLLSRIPKTPIHTTGPRFCQMLQGTLALTAAERDLMGWEERCTLDIGETVGSNYHQSHPAWPIVQKDGCCLQVPAYKSRLSKRST